MAMMMFNKDNENECAVCSVHSDINTAIANIEITIMDMKEGPNKEQWKLVKNMLDDARNELSKLPYPEMKEKKKW